MFIVATGGRVNTAARAFLDAAMSRPNDEDEVRRPHDGVRTRVVFESVCRSTIATMLWP